MSTLFENNPTGRFTGLAKVYAKYRPSYPSAAIDAVMRRCTLKAGSVLVDVGCGTGISSRLFAERSVEVIGIEPNAEMRKQAEAEFVATGLPQPSYRDGRAEATSLPTACADVVLAAQAFHWFVPDDALREFHRILRPAGWAVLLWNERDERDPFTAAYGAVIRTAPETAKVEGPRGSAGEPLLHSPYFQNGERTVFSYEQVLGEEEMLGRAFSASYAPREPERAAQFAADLKGVFAHFQQQGQVVLRYETTVYSAKRREAALSAEG